MCYIHNRLLLAHKKEWTTKWGTSKTLYKSKKSDTYTLQFIKYWEKNKIKYWEEVNLQSGTQTGGYQQQGKRGRGSNYLMCKGFFSGVSKILWNLEKSGNFAALWMY